MKKFDLPVVTISFLVLFCLGGISGFAQSYLGLDGGFEGTATIDNTNVFATPQSLKWAKANATQTIVNETSIVRTGGNSLRASNSTTGRRIWSPNISVPSVTTNVTLQLWRYVTNTTNTQEIQLGIQNNTEGLSGTYTSPSIAGTWEKVTYTKSSSTFTSVAGVIWNRQVGTGGNIYLDDIVVYAGGVDVSAPSPATAVTVTQNASTAATALDLSWTAAVGGVDNGGYMAVRYTTNPNADNDPNANGVYAIGNIITNGTGGLVGTVEYIGTGTSFTDNDLIAGTTYYYKIYTYDKAYNYAAEANGNGTTSAAGLNPPTLSAATGATVDAPFEVTFVDDAAWRTTNPAITVDGTPLTAGYAFSPGKITFTPSASIPAGLLQIAGANKNITVIASGYTNATVLQTITAGAATRLGMSSQPAAPASNGSVFATQPVVNIQDQYGNTTISAATVTATTGEGAWAPGGNTTASGIVGIASFEGLTAGSAAAVTGATISFTSPGLTPVASGTFNIPAPAPANDLCINAVVLTVNAVATSGSLSGATITNATLNKNDVYYSFTPNCTGNHTITIDFALGPDIDFEVYATACPGSVSSRLVNAITSGGVTETSTNSYIAGTTYLIRVIDYFGTASAFNISVSSVPALTLSNTGTPVAGNISTGSSNTVLFGFTLTPDACATSYDFTGVTISKSGTSTTDDISNLQLVYDGNTNGVYDSGVDIIASVAAQPVATSIVFSLSGQTGLSVSRRYLLIGDVANGAIVGRTFTGSLTANNATTNAMVSGSASGNTQSVISSDGYLAISTLGIAVTENFNSIGTSATASLPNGFRMGSSSNSTDFGSLQLTTTNAAGTSGAGAIAITSGAYNFANGVTASSTDRAIGFLNAASFTSPRSIIVKVRNNTGSTITDLAVAFDYEKYRSGSRAFNMNFFHGSSTTPSTVAVAGDQAYAADLNNNVVSDPPISITKSVNITNLNIVPGQDYYLRWTLTGIGGSTNGQAIGIDNISITATAEYTWNGTTTDYQVSTNWTPIRTAPAATDILNFTNTATVTNVPTQTVGRLNVSGNGVAVSLSGSNTVLTIDGNSSYSFHIGTGSSLTLSNINMKLKENALVNGSFTTNKYVDLNVSGKELIVNGNIDFGTAGYVYNTNGGGKFTLNSGATLTTGNVDGINGGPNNGSVLVSGITTYSSNANYTFNGNVTNPGFSNITFSTAGVITGVLTIATGLNTVLMDGSLAVSTLVLHSGTLSTGSNMLTIGFMSRNAGSINATSGTLVFSNSSPFTIPASAVNNTIGALVVNSSSTLTTSDAHTITGSVSISSGGLLLGNDMFIKGNLTKASAASFLPNNKKITLNGIALQTLTVSSSGTLTVFDLEIDNASGVALATGTSIIVDGTLTLTDGEFDVTTNSLTLNGPAISGNAANLSVSTTADLAFAGSGVTQTIPASITQVKNLTIGTTNTIMPSGSLVVTGAMIVNGTFRPAASDVISGSGTLSGTGVIQVTRSTGSSDLSGQYTLNKTLTGLTVEMKGADPQGLESGSFAALTIDNTNNVTLSGAIVLTGALSLTNGKLLLGANNITTGSIENGGALSYIVTNGAGAVIRKALNGLEEFPIGISVDSYSPVSIDNPGLKDWTVNVVSGIVPSTGTHPANRPRALQRTWNLIPSSAPGATDLSFSYNTSNANILGAEFTPGEEVITNHYNSNTSRWEIAGSAQDPIPVGSVYTVTVSGQTAFSPFAISEAEGALPVTLVSFCGRRVASGNLLKWETASEVNNRGFELQVSSDGRVYSKLSFIPSAAAGGNSTERLLYSYTHATSGTKKFYRLKQVDFDGRFKMSATINVHPGDAVNFKLTNVVPNPVLGTLNFQVEAPIKTIVQLYLSDGFGRVVKQAATAIEAGTNAMQLNMSTLPAGTYLLQVVTKDGSEPLVHKLIKQ
ncbi:MAG: hypothetical protein JWP69_1587 [Flaviaesturariibacter sp.]|nr:hypothetical protein [Flaviaesturariibacter sp.]